MLHRLPTSRCLPRSPASDLAGQYFNEAADALLQRLPNLQALHLGNNQLDGKQIEGLAATLLRHKPQIQNL